MFKTVVSQPTGALLAAALDALVRNPNYGQTTTLVNVLSPSFHPMNTCTAIHVFYHSVRKRTNNFDKVIERHSAVEIEQLLPASYPFWPRWFVLEHGFNVGSQSSIMDVVVPTVVEDWATANWPLVQGSCSHTIKDRHSEDSAPGDCSILRGHHRERL